MFEGGMYSLEWEGKQRVSCCCMGTCTEFKKEFCGRGKGKGRKEGRIHVYMSEAKHHRIVIPKLSEGGVPFHSWVGYLFPSRWHFSSSFHLCIIKFLSGPRFFSFWTTTNTQDRINLVRFSFCTHACYTRFCFAAELSWAELRSPSSSSSLVTPYRFTKVYDVGYVEFLNNSLYFMLVSIYGAIKKKEARNIFESSVLLQ